MWCHIISHFLILSRKPIGTALESSCLKSGTDITGLVLILMISDQCTYTCVHHNTPFYALISHILTLNFVRFPDLLWLESGICENILLIILSICALGLPLVNLTFILEPITWRDVYRPLFQGHERGTSKRVWPLYVVFFKTTKGW